MSSVAFIIFWISLFLCVNVESGQYPASFDCPMRELAIEFAQNIQPSLTVSQLQDIADALNGSPESRNCNISALNLPNEPTNKHRIPITWNAYYSKAIYVDYANGNDNNDGSVNSPLKHIDIALDLSKTYFGSSQQKTIILRKGRHYLRNTLYITPKHNNLLITNYDNESAEISGAVPLSCSWKLYKNGANNKNIYSCDLSGNKNMSDVITALRVNNIRAIRARYPNAVPETEGFSSELDAVSWFPSVLPNNPDQNINPSTPLRNDTTQNWFQTYSLGIGGPCTNFYPAAGYWCANTTNGGGAFTYKIPQGLTYNASILPNTPYKDGSQIVVQAWRPAYWASWMFEVGEYDAHQQTMNFSKGGFQGARGDNYGAEFYVENVMEELDFPTEFFYNYSTKILYYYNNETGKDPSNLVFEAPQLKVLVNYTGSMTNPVKNVNIRGITFRDADITYMDPHGMPSGGDWGVQRSGALYMEGTENCRIESNLMTRLEGNAISINRYNRNLTILRNEIVWNGDTAIVLWGDTQNISFTYDKTTMGPDATNLNQPRGIKVLQNLIHEIGIWEKQSAAYFQAKSCNNIIAENIIYNGPRAGINFNDGMGGNNTIARNLIFNVVRESSDHGPFNSWDRQVYVTKVKTGEPSVMKAEDHIHHNFIIGNYHSQEAIDTDDGSCYFTVDHNFFPYSIDNGLKSDYGGHDVIHHNNIYAYVANTCFSISIGDQGEGQLPGHIDQFYNNTCVLNRNITGIYDYGRFYCKASQNQWPRLGNNMIYTLSGSEKIGLCQENEATFQSKNQGIDDNTKADVVTASIDAALIAQAKAMLFN